MDIKKVKALTQIFTDAKLTELEFCGGDSKLTLKRSYEVTKTQVVSSTAENISVTGDNSSENNSTQAQNYKIIKAPFAGMFYTRPSPDSEPFVNVGDKVEKSDIVCILEAMKLMNELKAELDGVIVEVCAEDSSVVEFGQVLFKLS